MISEVQPQTTSLMGLSEKEADERMNDGQGNDIALGTSRSYGQILRQNVFTFINVVLFSIGVVLVTLGLYTDALLSVGIVMMNVVIGVIQEARAKQHLDKISLLTRPKARVIRDGQEKVIDPARIVLGDILVAGAGDQIVVDGEVVGEGRAEVDESLLTGEADLILKRAGDSLYSGSFIVTGRIHFEATRVGAESFANQLTSSARIFKTMKTPLQQDIDFVIRILILLVVQMGILLGLSALLGEVGLSQGARVAAVIAGLIPNGLFFMITIAYALGAVRMSGRGALIQKSNAVESMSNVSVLCLDKTGTLTANRINFHVLHPLTIDDEQLRASLGIFAASGHSSNRTTEAIRAALPGDKLAVVDEVPFSSKLKWSAMSFDQGEMRGAYVLGAAEMLQPHLRSDIALGTEGQVWANEGLRVLLFAHQPDVTALHDENDQPNLPDNLIPLGVIAFSDELRPEARTTLAGFAQAGITLKIISGDNPYTVAALAKQAGLSDDLNVVSGVELMEMDNAQFVQVAEEATVFGRITPPAEGKAGRSALLSRGHYVAMIGDGVNDVLSLKKANIGIAMQSGSDATRGVADIVLLNDSFAALPSSFQEGQRIINGMEDILRLYLVRVFTMALIIIGVSILQVGFPFSPINSSLITLLSVGIPTFALAAWARPGKPEDSIVRSVLHFVIPSAFTLSIAAIIIYVFFYSATFNSLGGVRISTSQEVITLELETGVPIQEFMARIETESVQIAQTALTTLMVFCGLFLVVFVEPPTRFFVAGDTYSGDWRPTILAIALLISFIIIIAGCTTSRLL